MQIRTMERAEFFARARSGLFAALLVAACGSGSSSGGVGDAGETILSRTVTLSPETETIFVNQTLKISATLVTKTRQANGKLFTHITPDISKFDWSVLEADGGSIGANGTSGATKLYQAPAAPGVFHLQVVLKDDPSVTDTSTITVIAQPPCPTDLQAADDTPCTEEKRVCSQGDCTNKVCLFSGIDAGPPTCFTIICSEFNFGKGRWHYAAFSLDPVCAADGGTTDAGSDASGDSATDGSRADSGSDGS
jgi:hypothetical protein